MRIKLLTLAAVTTIALGCAEKQQEPAEVALETNKDKVSYILGTNVGSQFVNQGIELNQSAFVQGMQDAIDGNDPRLSEEQMMEAFTEFQAEEMARREKEMAELSEANRAEGEAYLAGNAAKEGVVTTESGLQYKEIVAGEGATPGAEDVVEVHYRGTLIDGTEFDSSYKRGVPAQFGVNQVIPGWTEALQLMQEGDKWELTIPSNLAYGPGGTGGSIGPDQTLLFEVELLTVNPGAEESEEANE
ncbi:MAG: FKBP-type peptidyl-prolyl cis-trans isomerase [bacterium]